MKPNLDGLSASDIAWAGVILKYLEKRATQDDKSKLLVLIKQSDL
jgi:hypothetical protein